MSTTGTVITYGRVSTARQGSASHGLATQRDTVARFVADRYPGWPAEHVEDICSGMTAPGERDGLGPAIHRLSDPDDPATVLAVASIDRLSRDSLTVLDLLIRVAGANGFTIRTADTDADISTAAGFLAIGVQAIVGHSERMRILERTAAGRERAMAAGVKFGPPVRVPDNVRARIVNLRAAGFTLKQIADSLNGEKVPTASGQGSWFPAQVSRVYTRAIADGIRP